MKKIILSGGGGGGGSTHTPVEAENTLQATTTAQIIDFICEGEIEGPANGTDEDTELRRWEKSIYLNETALFPDNDDEDATYNFQGVTVNAMRGVEDAVTVLKDYDSIDSITELRTELTVALSPISFTITDIEVDSVYVTIEIPALVKQEDNGDLNPTIVKYHIDVIGDNGAGTTWHAVTADGSGKIEGKTISTYRKQHYIENLYDNCGVGPWLVRVYRDTADSESSRLSNKTYVFSYTESKEVKMLYPDSCIVGLTIDAKQFGDTLPSRAYKIKGLKIKYPNNYTPYEYDEDGVIVEGTGEYDGEWDGDFVVGYCNNPAWVVYDLLTNERYGLGEEIDSSMINKWQLYTIGQYCDQQVTIKQKTRSYAGISITEEITEPRFTFNGVINSRSQALALINHLCSVFRGYPLYSAGYVTFKQDCPTDITRIATQANVEDGLFTYSDIEADRRTTVANVSYNNMDLFGRSDTVIVQDDENIQEYGYNVTEITCFGCTKKSEAVRRAKYILRTDLTQTEIVKFTGGIEWADALPGEVIGVQDRDYVSADLSGRLISTGSSAQFDIDREVTIVGGETYTLYVVDTTSNLVHETTLINSPGTTSTLTFSPALPKIPVTNQLWALTKSSVTDVRQFQIISIKESDGGFKYDIEAIYYNENKYSEVEDGATYETLPATNLPIGELEAPSNVQIQAFTYTDGDSSNRKYGMLIGWVASPDVRTLDYEIYYEKNDGIPTRLITTAETSYKWLNVSSGTYTLKVRARSATGLLSKWAYYPNFYLNTQTGTITPPTNLRTIDDPEHDQFTGPDCEVEWDASNGAYYDSSSTVIISDGTAYTTLEYDTDTSTVGTDTIAGYQVRVYKTDDTLLRVYNTADHLELQYTYTYNMNKTDNGGVPIREIKFKVWTIDRYGDVSGDAATLVASNPAPDMSSTSPDLTPKPTYIKIEWDPVVDNDMSHYELYIDGTSVTDIAFPLTYAEFSDVIYGELYDVQIRPWDLFGPGVISQSEEGFCNKVPSENVDVELQQSVEITDSLDSDSTALISLYDSVWTTGGVTYPASTLSWVLYDFGIENFINGVQIWAGSTMNCYFEVERYDGSKRYYGGNGSHALVSSYDQERLTEYSSLANSATNYWTTGTDGYIHAFLPNGVVARKCKMYLTYTSDIDLYELVFRRIVIAEDIATESLSAITADIGTVTAGSIQSQYYGTATKGMLMDLDSEFLIVKDTAGTIRVKLGKLS